MPEIRKRSLEKSNALWQEAQDKILSGCQLYSKGPETHIEGVSPIYIDHGKDAHVWDVDGNEYIDYDMGLGPILLGYQYKAVDDAVVAQLRRGGFTGDAVWVGDGDLGLRRMLTAAGVRVTGWLGPADLEAMLRESIYIHSARYEGFPLSILDAAVCGAPIVARRISALERTGLLMASAAHDVADLVARLLRSPEAVDRCRLRGEALLASHLPEQLARALATLYTKALSEESE